MKVGKFPGAGKPDGRSLYLLELFSRILIQTCCPSTSYILDSALTRTVLVEWQGGCQLPTVKFSTVAKGFQDQTGEGLP